jgi:hypothetical protein
MLNINIKLYKLIMKKNGENVTPSGENVTPNGENVTPNGENVTLNQNMCKKCN